MTSPKYLCSKFQWTQRGGVNPRDRVISQIEDAEIIDFISADSEILKGKKILDVTCGGRQIWFQKNEPHTLYCDKRKAHFEDNFGSNHAHRVLDIDPDIGCNFTNLPFPDNTFNLVVLDPPHLIGKSDAWMKKAFSYYASKEAAVKDVSDGIRECMRVLKIGGVLIFKWSEIQISSQEIIAACGIQPLFGHRSGRKMNTHWMTFMKF